MGNIQELYEKLYQRIIKTRAARIVASERLERYDRHYQLIQLIYAVFLTACSVWIFYLEKTNRMSTTADASTILLICSFAITGITFYGNSKNYKERSLQMKSNYIALGKLLYDIEVARCVEDDIVRIYQEHYEKYTGLLEAVENHITFDYLESLGSNRKDMKIKYICGFIEHRLLSWLILLIPLGVILWLIFL
jgi:hypothetical protein